MSRRLLCTKLLVLMLALIVGQTGIWISTVTAQQSVTVFAPAYNATGTGTGVSVQQGQHLSFLATGRWCMGGRGIDLDVPRGECGGPGGIRWAHAVEQPLLLPSAQFGTLLGRIGSSTFAIGSAAEVTAPESGEIILIFNERRGGFGDNSGSVRVTISTSRVPSGPPSLMTPVGTRETWRVDNGYNGGACHYRVSPCGSPHDERYALDIVPEEGDAGGRAVFSPVSGTAQVIETSDIGTLVKISVPGNYVVHLYHLMDVPEIDGSYVRLNEWIGYVWDSYRGLNHLHIHVSDQNGSSVPLTIAGFTYNSQNGEREWIGRQIRDNTLCSENTLQGYPWYFTESIPDLSATAFGNNPVWSLQLNEGCTVTLFDRPWYAGTSRTYTRSTILVEGFGDRVRSVRLTC